MEILDSMKCVCNNPLLLNPDGASVSSYSIKPFIDFDSFLSWSRLTLPAVGSGCAPFWAFYPRIALVPCRCSEDQTTWVFFPNFTFDFACALRNVCSISLCTTAHFHNDKWGFQQWHFTPHVYLTAFYLYWNTSQPSTTWHHLFLFLFSHN